VRLGATPPIPLRHTAFARLVTNLLDNAVAYGAPPIEVSGEHTGGRYVLEVRDAGPGIPPADVERLKQPFTRASHARTNAAGVAGAGLGLAIVDRIARLHGGTFDLLPRPGGGTIARVSLPAGA
jgi:two-component system osmolarity sensor histidine kinase EnvZ